MMHTIVEEGLVAASFVADRTSGFEELREERRRATAPRRWRRCAASRRRRSARSRGCTRRRGGSMILWGMGISQHVHGTDNARCLIALSLMTGQVGRPGTGLHPLRGQNNVQGASDAGLIPMMFPDYQRVDNAGARGSFEALWGARARPEARAHRRRDHGRRARGQDPRHVHHGREPGDVRPRRRARAAGARRARDAGRAGHLPHRDRAISPT